MPLHMWAVWCWGRFEEALEKPEILILIVVDVFSFGVEVFDNLGLCLVGLKDTAITEDPNETLDVFNNVVSGLLGEGGTIA
jgi:hypothetical protein